MATPYETRRIYGPSQVKSDFLTLASDLTGSGSGGGSRLMNVDGTTPKYFTFGPGAGVDFILLKFVLTIQLTGDPEMDQFASGAALSNGLIVGAYNSAGSQLSSFYGNYTIKDNGDLYRASYSHGRGGPGQGGASSVQTITGVWDFCVGPNCMQLNGDSGHKVAVIVQDNLSALDKITGFAQVFEG